MQRKHVAQQAQRERNCSPTNATGHRASARIARVGVSALGFASAAAAGAVAARRRNR